MAKPYLPSEFWDAAKDVELPDLPNIDTTMKKTPGGGLVCECRMLGDELEEWAKDVARLVDDAVAAAIVEEIAERNGYVRERTCTFSESNVNDDPYDAMPTCSECGYEAEETEVCEDLDGTITYYGSYCRECGARVVE